MPDVSSPPAPLKHLYLQAYRFQGNCIIHFEKPFNDEPPDGRFQRYKTGVEMDCADRRQRPPVFLLRIASISAAAAEKLEHVSMCCENTGGPAGAHLLANWTGNKNGNLQSGHGFGFGPLSARPPSHPLIPNGRLSASLHPSMQEFPFLQSTRAKHNGTSDRGFLLLCGQQSRGPCGVEKRGSWKQDGTSGGSVKGGPSSQKLHCKDLQHVSRFFQFTQSSSYHQGLV